jgi:integrase
MPRKPKAQKRVITVVVNGSPVAVVLHPPAGRRTSWYAYTAGWVSSKSTGQADFNEAVKVVEAMLRNGGRRAELKDRLLSDEELEQIQVTHFGRKTDPDAVRRARKSLEECLDALNAFKALSGLSSISAATPDDCAAFQRKALALPKNWRSKHPRSKETTATISPSTVVKWSRCLASGFERANRTAGKKCVRGVVDEGKLLTSNPWTQFTWIEASKRPIRQFDSDELLGLLTFMEESWSDVPVAAAAAKVFLWSGCRKLEVAGLTWEMLRIVGDEYHFEVLGKWAVTRWFRVPQPVYRELLALRTPSSPFVFAGYAEQIRERHADNVGCTRKIREDFTAKNFGRWVYERVKEWAEKYGKGRAFLHVFRKTALQHARRGEDINRQVAEDARVGESVMMTSYVKETDEELRARSNRTFARIVASLPSEVARRYGHAEPAPTPLEQQLQAATAAKDWDRVAALSVQLARKRRPDVG